MAEQPPIDFAVPEGHVLVENVGGDVQLPLEDWRLVRHGEFWHMDPEHAADLPTEGAIQWRVRTDLPPQQTAPPSPTAVFGPFGRSVDAPTEEEHR